jgi:hypothetical protein
MLNLGGPSAFVGLSLASQMETNSCVSIDDVAFDFLCEDEDIECIYIYNHLFQRHYLEVSQPEIIEYIRTLT